MGAAGCHPAQPTGSEAAGCTVSPTALESVILASVFWSHTICHILLLTWDKIITWRDSADVPRMRKWNRVLPQLLHVISLRAHELSAKLHKGPGKCCLLLHIRGQGSSDSRKFAVSFSGRKLFPPGGRSMPPRTPFPKQTRWEFLISPGKTKPLLLRSYASWPNFETLVFKSL